MNNTGLLTLLAIFALLASYACAQDVPFAEQVALSQKSATSAFPDLGKVGSDLNQRFVVEYARLKASNDILLKNPNWPRILAGRCAEDLRIEPAVGNKTPISAMKGTDSPRSVLSDARVSATTEKYKMHVIAKILIFRKDGVIARIKPIWNRHEVDAQGHETSVIYPDKYLVGDEFTNSVFIECSPPENVATGEETRMFIYPCGILQEGNGRYRKYTVHPQAVVDYLHSGNGPLEEAPPYPAL